MIKDMYFYALSSAGENCMGLLFNPLNSTCKKSRQGGGGSWDKNHGCPQGGIEPDIPSSVVRCGANH